MEIRWVAGDLVHRGAMQRAGISPSAEGPVAWRNSCMCVSQMSAEARPSPTTPCSLVSCENGLTAGSRNRISRRRGLGFVSSSRDSAAATASTAVRRRASRMPRSHGLSFARRCAGAYGVNDILDDKLGQTKFLRKEGLIYGHRTRTHASSDSSSSQPGSPATPSSPSSSSSATASTSTTTTAPTPPPKTQQLKQIFAPILSLPSSIWRQVVLPLSNFGFGKTSIWEGGVGLFIISGFVLFAIAITWLRGVKIRSKNRRYEAVIEFSRAQGIMVGTPVRIRGVDVGSVVGMRPSLEKIDVVVQLADIGICIPRNALVEVNQSGLISETLIDVTPRDPIPRPTLGPLEDGCSQEGLIVCDKEKIKGEQGVSLDELVWICTKLARQIGDVGVGNVYMLTERIAAAIDEAKPLLAKAEILAGDFEPLVKELKDGVFLKDLERLAKMVTETGDDLRILNKSVLTTENTELLRQSVVKLTKTLSHIESISQDVSGVTGDAGTKKNLRQLIESLSRLIMD